MIYGTNYTHFSNLHATPTAGVGMQGVISTYHLPGMRDLAKQQMGKMLENKLTALRIPLYCGPAENFIQVGLTDGFLLNLLPGGQLVPQEWENLNNHLDDVASMGFDFVAIGPGFADGILNPYTWTQTEPNWHRAGWLLYYLRQLMQARTWKAWYLDLAAELIDPRKKDFTIWKPGDPDPAPVALEYARTLWAWFNQPGVTRVSNATISCIAHPDLIAAMPYVFGGCWPDLEFHMYSPEDGVPYGSVHEQFVGTVAAFKALGAPSDVVVRIGETYDFNDLTNAAEIEFGITEHPEFPLVCISQWPELRWLPNSSPALSPWPQSVSM